jgi:hypothetical protein
MRKGLYPCSQPALYAVARTGWGAYQRYLSHFSAYRGYYDASFGNAALAVIDTTEAIPDLQARYANTEVYHIQLKHQCNTCLARWQSLKRYITSSFPPSIHKARLEEAGALRYRKARNYNWEELQTMNVSAISFINNHQAALLAHNNMPPTFAAAYSADTAAFSAKLEQFISSEQNSYAATDAKISANNAVYTQLINMFKDGQEIFRGQEGIRRQFVFNKVLALISQPAATHPQHPPSLGNPTQP